MWDFIKERGVFLSFIALLMGGFVALVGYNHSHPRTTTAVAGIQAGKPPAALQDIRMSKGNSKSNVVLVQYSDFLCPSCSYVSTQVMPVITKKYIDTGQVAFEFRPMAFIAPGSAIAAQGAYCAVDQAKFWQYHDAIYEYVWSNAFSKGVDPTKTTVLTSEIIKQISLQAGLDAAIFDPCLDNGKYATKVQSVTTVAQNQGVTSTPFIMVNGTAIRGNMTLTTIEAMIKSQL